MDSIENNNQQQPEPKSNSTIWIAGVIILALIVGGVIYFRSQTTEDIKEKENGVITATPTPSSTNTPNPSPTLAPAVQGEEKVFTVEGSNFKFSLSEIKVKKGDKVKVVFNNVGGFHDFVIDEFNVKTSRISGGASETVSFVADKTGRFEYYCSVGEHRAMGMKGNLIVE